MGHTLFCYWFKEDQWQTTLTRKCKTATADDGSTGYEMKIGLGTIAMLISATGMGLVPLFSRWATRTDMFDGALGLNAGRLHRCFDGPWAA